MEFCFFPLRSCITIFLLSVTACSQWHPVLTEFLCNGKVSSFFFFFWSRSHYNSYPFSRKHYSNSPKEVPSATWKPLALPHYSVPDLFPSAGFVFMIINFSSISVPTVWELVINPLPSPFWFPGWLPALFLARGIWQNVQGRTPSSSAIKDRWHKWRQLRKFEWKLFLGARKEKEPKANLGMVPSPGVPSPAWLSRQSTAGITHPLIIPPALCLQFPPLHFLLYSPAVPRKEQPLSQIPAQTPGDAAGPISVPCTQLCLVPSPKNSSPNTQGLLAWHLSSLCSPHISHLSQKSILTLIFPWVQPCQPQKGKSWARSKWWKCLCRWASSILQEQSSQPRSPKISWWFFLTCWFYKMMIFFNFSGDFWRCTAYSL